MPTPSEGGGGGGGRLTTDSAVVGGGGGGGRVSFTTNSSLGNETCLPADVPPPKIAQPRDHEASVVVWTDLSLHDVDELLQASEVNAVALQEKIAEFFDLKGLGISFFVLFFCRCSVFVVVIFFVLIVVAFVTYCCFCLFLLLLLISLK